MISRAVWRALIEQFWTDRLPAGSWKRKVPDHEQFWELTEENRLRYSEHAKDVYARSNDILTLTQ